MNEDGYIDRLERDYERLSAENKQHRRLVERLREALAALVADVEDYGEPRRHEGALDRARRALAAGE